MDKFIEVARFLLSLGPQLMEFIRHVEAVTLEAGIAQAGAQKAGLVVGFVMAALEALPDELRAKLPVAKIESAIRLAINVVVTAFNAIGIFKKSA